MRILFLGGTGIISTSCVALALARGHEVYVLNRGRRGLPPGARQISADLWDEGAVAHALGDLGFDAVVDFLCYRPEDAERDLRLFRGRAGQLVFISSASAYQKPPTHPLITESTPLANPYWQYSRDKIACEERFLRAYREEGFPVVVVRPSLTYGDTQIPLAVNSWEKPWTAVDRMKRGLPVIVPGDGTSPWTFTHADDFAKGLVGLLGHPLAVGHAFHITSDEALTWDQAYAAVAAAAGVARPCLVHVASDFLAACEPELTGTLLGDKARAAIFDNTKIKRFVPDYVATIRWADGIRRTVAWFEAEPSRRAVDEALQHTWDRILEAYGAGLEAARRLFPHAS